MKNTVKYAAAGILIILAIGLVIRLRECGRSHESAGVKMTVTVPVDTNFAPVQHQTHRPPSLPFIGQKMDVVLPSGVKENDVERVTSVKWKDRERPTNIIELKTGEIFVQKDSTIESITVTDLLAPIVSVDISPGFGLSVQLGFSSRRWEFSPSVTLSPFTFFGWLKGPAVMADLSGAGVGLEARLYHDIYLGPSVVWRYDDLSQRMLRINVHYYL